MHDAVFRQSAVYHFHTLLQIILGIRFFPFRQRDSVRREFFFIVAAKFRKHGPRRIVRSLTDPKHGSKENQEQENNPDNSRFSKPPPLIPLEDVAEKDKA